MENKEKQFEEQEEMLNADENKPEEIDWQTKCELLTHNLESVYARIRQLEKQISDRALKERSSDMLISQAVSVLSNTVMLSIKNKEN